MQKPIVSVDLTQITAALNHITLRKVFPVKHLRPYAADVRKYSPHKSGSRIDIFQPNPEIFHVLKCWQAKLGQHQIEQLEIAQDIPCDSDADAIFFLEWIKDTMRLEGFPRHHIEPTPKDASPNEEKFGPFTEYLGTRYHFQLKFYCRIAKDGSNRPCLRMEFTLWRPMLAAIGIHTVDDLDGVDVETYAYWFKDLWNTYVQEKTVI